MLSAPASPQASASSSIWPGASLTPGISGAIRTPTGIPARRSSATASIRLRGCGRVRLGLPPGLLLQGRDREVGDELGPLADLLHQLDVAQQQRRLGQHRARVGEVAHRLPDPLHQPVAPLDPLVRVGVGTERDVLALPGRPAQLGADDLGHVDLDDDLALEVLARVEVQVGVGRAGEAVDKTHAWVQPRYGLIVQRNGILDCLGTRFRPERASHLVKADPERLGSIEGADRGLTHPGQQALRACSLLEVIPTHEHMFAYATDGRESLTARARPG